LLAPLLFAFQSLVVGETCPAPADVEARVRDILHLPAGQKLTEGFVVERHEAGLYVELRSAESAVIGQRTLPAEGTCDELAQAAAVVLSAWLSDVHPDFAGALPAAEPPPPARAPEPAPAPVAGPVGAPVPATRPPALPSPAPLPPSLPSPPARRFELALELGSDVCDRGFAFAGSLRVDFAPPARGLGLSANVGGVWPRREGLGTGFVEWRRWPLGIGPSVRVSSRDVRWDFSAGPSVAWLHLEGSNFDHPSSQDGVDWGAFLAARGATRGRRAGLLLAANAQIFPSDSGAYARGDGGPWFLRLPNFSVGLAVGAWLAP